MCSNVSWKGRLSTLFLLCAFTLMLGACSQEDPQEQSLCPFLPNGRPIVADEQLYPDPLQETQAASSESLQAISHLEDGVYVGRAYGMCGPIEVTVRIDKGQLKVESIWQEGETQGVGGYEAIADGTFAAMINKAQGPEIASVSGATGTTVGIKEALKQALEQAPKK